MSVVDKAEKYDRQLRLWGVEGQQALENANVAAIYATVTSCEALKNIVLPGIGTFTVIDDGKVEEADIGKNFFVTKDSVGKSKAEVTTELLQELNPDVRGSYRDENPITLIHENIETFDQYSLVIATTLPEPSLILLADYLYEKKIPFIYFQVSGLFSTIRIQVDEHKVIESKPISANEDLRITAPWPQLSEYSSSFDFNSLDPDYMGHIPYSVLLYHFLEQWKNTHEGKVPTGGKEQMEFKHIIETSKIHDSENYTEAVQNARYAWLKPIIPGTVQEILDSTKCTSLSDSSDYWICCRALREFINKNGVMPLRGTLPDMHSNTKFYLELQTIYQEKAQKDVLEMLDIINELLPSTGRPIGAVKETFVTKFCKNAFFLRVNQYRRISLEYSSSPENEALRDVFEYELDAFWYLVMRGVSRFYSSHHRFPGSQDSDVNDDFGPLKNYVTSVCNDLGISPSVVPDEAIQEMCRHGGAEIHSVCSFIGAMISQEIIKLLTNQLVPFDNTFVYNGVKNSGTTLLV